MSLPELEEFRRFAGPNADPESFYQGLVDPEHRTPEEAPTKLASMDTDDTLFYSAQGALDLDSDEPLTSRDS